MPVYYGPERPPDDSRSLCEFMGHRSGWFADPQGWVFWDAHRCSRQQWKRAKPRKSRRCGALLEDGHRCAGPYHCPEH